MRFLWRMLINAAAIFVAGLVIPGITYGGYPYGFGDADKYISLGLTGLVLGLVNAFVRPLLVLISLPITCLTLGLFLLVINALMLLLVAAIEPLGFGVAGFVEAFFGAIVISIVSAILSWVLPD